jgi:hypothetical protein
VSRPVSSPLLAKVLFMEDTFATAATFKIGGAWKVRSDPEGKEFEV